MINVKVKHPDVQRISYMKEVKAEIKADAQTAFVCLLYSKTAHALDT